MPNLWQILYAAVTAPEICQHNVIPCLASVYHDSYVTGWGCGAPTDFYCAPYPHCQNFCSMCPRQLNGAGAYVGRDVSLDKKHRFCC